MTCEYNKKETLSFMICQKCKKNKATTYITRTINGVTQEMALCPKCAAEYGLGGFKPMSLGDLFAPLFKNDTGYAPHSVLSPDKRCSGCGSSFSDIVRSGKVGCAQCYTDFYDRLVPSIERIHGRAVHTGKVSGSAPVEQKREKEISDFEKELKKAVEDQNYEEAARLRDIIREMKGEDNNDSAK